MDLSTIRAIRTFKQDVVTDQHSETVSVPYSGKQYIINANY
jgi:hypothetical protein